MHPYHTLVRAFDAGQITRDELRHRAAVLRATDPLKPLRSPSIGLGNETGVPAAFLAPIVEDEIRLQDKAMYYERTEDDRTVNVRTLLSETLADQLRVDDDSGRKSLHRVVTEDTEMIHIRVADAIITSLGLTLSRLDLPFLPGNISGAREQVEAHLDATEQEMDDFSKEALAHQLERFAKGFANGGLLTGDEVAYERQRGLNRHLARRRVLRAAA